MRTLGILGGMGPAATADFYRKLIAATPARGDAEHLPVLIYGVPQIPDRSRAIEGGGASPAPALRRAARALAVGGAQAIVMPCNTAHHWHALVEQSARRPCLHIVDAVLAQLARCAPRARRIGLLATAGTLAADIYPARAAAAGLQWLAPVPEVQRGATAAAIAAVKAGDAAAARPLLRAAAEHLVECGAETLVAACTEVPLALDATDCTVPLIDSTAALAEHCVAWARRSAC
ncbi:MAG: amino acid racemase [Burkholderiales bacterium]|jgi:aspartate racemase|nr:amino acid racemase [Burkholderiales bacterium]